MFDTECIESVYTVYYTEYIPVANAQLTSKAVYLSDDLESLSSRAVNIFNNQFAVQTGQLAV